MNATTTQMLDDIADALPRIGAVELPRPTLATGTAYRPIPGSRVPIDVNPDALRQEVHATMGTWVRLCHEEGWCADDDWPDDDTHWILMWLRRHAVVLDHSDLGRDWERDVRGLWRRCRALTGDPVKPPLSLPCRRCGNALEGRDEHGRPAEQPQQWRWAACPLCGQTETLTDDLARIGRVDLLTIAEWADEFDLEVDTLKHRIQRAGLEPSDRDSRGRRLYRREVVATILDAAA